jgi:hypothetical protein
LFLIVPFLFAGCLLEPLEVAGSVLFFGDFGGCLPPVVRSSVRCGWYLLCSRVALGCLADAFIFVRYC